MSKLPIPESEYQDILSVVEDSIKIVKKDKGKDLMFCSDRIIHSASIYQDKYSLQLATAIYSMSKIMLNNYLRRKFSKRYESFITKALQMLLTAQGYLRKRDMEKYYKTISSLLTLIGKTDRRLGQYLEEVVRYSMVKKGSRIYTHGISMGRVAQILDVSEWELMSKVGWLPEKEYKDVGTLDPGERLRTMKEIFGTK